jgi:hypothetical protein
MNLLIKSLSIKKKLHRNPLRRFEDRSIHSDFVLYYIMMMIILSYVMGRRWGQVAHVPLAA